MEVVEGRCAKMFSTHCMYMKKIIFLCNTIAKVMLKKNGYNILTEF